MKGRTADFLLVSAEGGEFLHRSDIKDFDELVSGSCSDEVSTRGPRTRLYGVLVSVAGEGNEAKRSWLVLKQRREWGGGGEMDEQRCENFGRTGIPELDEVVFTPRDEEPFCRVPLDTLDVPPMTYRESDSNHQRRSFPVRIQNRSKARPTSQSLLLLHQLKVPQLDRPVVTARGEPIVVRGPTHVPNRFLVPLEPLQVVHVRLKVLYRSAVVGRDQPLSRSGPFHGSDGRVVCLFLGRRGMGELGRRGKKERGESVLGESSQS